MTKCQQCGPVEMRATAKVKKHANGFDYPTQLVGASTWIGADGQAVNVYYDPATGANGKALATDVLSRIDDMMNYFDRVFGVKGKGGNVIIANTGGGAYHYGCTFNSDAGYGSDWYEDTEGTVPVPGQPGGICDALVAAEVVESYMGLQNKGWNCGGSGGEGLSRVFSEIVSGGAKGAMGQSGYAAGPSWSGGDWISRDSGTDQDYDSTGCAVLYIWWMLKLGYTIDQIVQAGEPDGTLASNYAVLTGKAKTQAFADFKAAVNAVGGPGSFSGDNPFGAADPAYPGNNPPPPPPGGSVTLTASPTSGAAPLPVQFTASGPAGSLSGGFTLDFGDGSPVATTLPTSHTYQQDGVYTATLATATAGNATAMVTVGTAPPPSNPGSFPTYSGNLTLTGKDGFRNISLSGLVNLTPSGGSFPTMPDADEIEAAINQAFSDPRVVQALGDRALPTGLFIKIIMAIVPVVIADVAAGKTVQQMIPDIVAAILGVLAGG